MFKIAGSAELLQFFLYVPHTYDNFRRFHRVFGSPEDWGENLSRNALLMRAVQLVRDETTR